MPAAEVSFHFIHRDLVKCIMCCAMYEVPWTHWSAYLVISYEKCTAPLLKIVWISSQMWSELCMKGLLILLFVWGKEIPLLLTFTITPSDNEPCQSLSKLFQSGYRGDSVPRVENNYLGKVFYLFNPEGHLRVFLLSWLNMEADG